jgi:hypothetical protein
VLSSWWLLAWFTLWPHSCYMPCPSHPPDLIILIMFGEEYKLWSYSLCSFLQSPVTSSLFGPNILLSNLFPNTIHKISRTHFGVMKVIASNSLKIMPRTGGRLLVLLRRMRSTYCTLSRLLSDSRGPWASSWNATTIRNSGLRLPIHFHVKWVSAMQISFPQRYNNCSS